MAAPSADPKSSFALRWSKALEPFGFTPASDYFLKNYSRLKPYPLSHGEAMFVIHLMMYKWGADAPWPAYATVARHMGVSVKTARRFAASLAQKKYLHREPRVGDTNLFHTQPLTDAFEALMAEDGAAPKGRKKKHP